MLGGTRVILRRQLGLPQHGAHLHIKISLGLAGCPDGKEQVQRAHRRLGQHHLAQFGGQQSLDRWSAMHEFVVTHLEGVWPQYRQSRQVTYLAAASHTTCE